MRLLFSARETIATLVKYKCKTFIALIPGLDHVMPMRTRKVHSTETPWIPSSLKNLLQKQECAFSRGDVQMFRELRNCVNRERKMCCAIYYQAKVEHLRKCKPSEWWKEVKKLTRCSLAFTAQNDTLKSLQHLHEGIDQIGLANIINEGFLSLMHSFTPLPAASPCTTFSNYSENSLVAGRLSQSARNYQSWTRAKPTVQTTSQDG